LKRAFLKEVFQERLHLPQQDNNAMNTIPGLGVFPVMKNLPQSDADQKNALASSSIRKVICFALGPEGTNIAQASRAWLKRMEIRRKSEIQFGDTPEICLQNARLINAPGVLAVYWTCAVYSKESQFFFGNPDVLPFFFQETMLLDEMQLATTEANLSQVNGSIPKNWKISSHPSPQHLVNGVAEVILVNSNSAAAIHCKQGLSDACITTESARQIHGLNTIHSFGSPPMVFFGGITPFGVKLLTETSQRLRLS
jgi:hypothetical protein